MLIATTHKNTDFDGLASVIAATLLYEDCTGVIPKATNKNVNQFLSTHKTAFNLILPNQVPFDEVTKLVVVDTNQWHRLDRMDRLKNRPDLEIELWDHHMTGSGDIQASRSCREAVGSTVTLMVRELIKRNIVLSPLDSTVLLIGLYEDTGHLSYPSTTAEDARAAGYLLSNRADLNVAGFFLNPPYEETQKEILFEMMKETEKLTIDGLVIGFNALEIDKKMPDLATVVNMYRKIVNVDAVFVVFTTGDRNTVIGRSGTEAIHIGKIMQSMGGGGHQGAGSASVKSEAMDLDDIREQILLQLQTSHTGQATIPDIMSFPVISVSAETTMRKVQEIMTEKNVRGILVMEDDTIMGIIVLWDLKKISRERQWQSPVKAFMARKVMTISVSTSPTEATRLMIENDIGYLPVLQDGKVVGIVTRTDILTYFYDLLPG